MTTISDNPLYSKFWNLLQPHLFHLPYCDVPLQPPETKPLSKRNNASKLTTIAASAGKSSKIKTSVAAKKSTSKSPAQNSPSPPNLLKSHLKLIIQIYETIYKHENQNSLMETMEILTPKSSDGSSHKFPSAPTLEALKKWRHQYVKFVEKALQKRFEGYHEHFEKPSSMTPTPEDIFVQVLEEVDQRFTKQSILKLFDSVTLREEKITRIDSRFVAEFDSVLDQLSLTGNQIELLPSRLPLQMRIFNVGANKLSDASVKEFGAAPQKELQHLGLSFNMLENCEFLAGTSTGKKSASQPMSNFPNLLSLDLSYNNIHDLDGICTVLSHLPNLQLLFLNGNPVCMYRYFRDMIVTRLVNLVALNDVDITDEEREEALVRLEQKDKPVDSKDEENTEDDTPSSSSKELTPLPPSTVFIHFILRKLSGIELIGTPPRPEESSKKGKKKPDKKKKPKKGEPVEEEPPEYEKVVEYQVVIPFMQDIRTDWFREKEIIDLNLDTCLECHIGDNKFHDALRYPVSCRVYRRSKEVLVCEEEEQPAENIEELPEGLPPRIKNEKLDFVGEACVDLSSFMEEQEKDTSNSRTKEILSPIKDISKREEPVVGRMTLRGEVQLVYQKVEPPQQTEEPEQEQGKKGNKKKK